MPKPIIIVWEFLKKKKKKKKKLTDAFWLRPKNLNQGSSPPKFKMPTLDKFDSTGYPKAHLKMYIRAFRPLGADEELLAQMFQNTLIRATLYWFLNLEDS